MNFDTLVICGPTATGKTAFALDLARDYQGELISADSRQVFAHMTIGTGKDLPLDAKFHQISDQQGYALGYYEIAGAKIWLYDLATPDQPMSVAVWRQAAVAVIDKIKSNHKLPIIVGGTGFYLRSLFQPPATATVKPNLKLRKQLEKLSLEALQQMLQQQNPNKWAVMNHSDQSNSRRLIRALEVSTSRPSLTTSRQSDYYPLWIGLKANKDVLTERIKDRIKARIDAGFDQEVWQLMKQYPDFPHFQAADTPGYAQWLQHLQGAFGREIAVSQWTLAEVQYMKRQLTWFNQQPATNWFDINSDSWYAQAKQFIKSKGLPP